MTEEKKEASDTNELMESAIEQGWKPKEEFEGDVNAWVDYPEFVRRGELFDAIKKANKETKELKKALEELSIHHRKTLEAEQKQAMELLKKAKAEALREGEHEKVVEIDEQIAEVRALPKKEEQKTTPKFDEWVKDNTWYNEDKVLRAFANGLVQDLLAENKNMDLDSVFEEITKEVKQQFPHKFQKKSTKVLSGGGTRGTVNSKDVSYSTLTPEEKQMHDRFVRRNVMTSEEYIKQIKAQRQNEAR